MKNRKLTTLNDFIKVVQFSILNSISKYWKDLDSFKRDCAYMKEHHDTESNRIYGKIVKLFHIEHDTLLKIAGRDENGSKQLGRFLDSLNKSNTELVYVHKKTVTYKSGKKFNSDSWFYIPMNALDGLFSMKGTGANDPFLVNRKSECYTKRQHELIDNCILFKKKRSYTKSEKFILSRKHKCNENEAHDSSLILTKMNLGSELSSNEADILISDIEL